MAGVFLCLVFGGAASAQQSGSRFSGSLTFANTGSATLKFAIPSLIVDPNSLPTTTLLLEFGKDGSTSPVDPGLSNAVTFTLKQGAQNVLPPFQLNALPSGQVVLNGTKQISMGRPNAAAAPGLYKLGIVHLQNSQSADTWELDIAGLPINVTPAVRTNATLTGANSGFSDLTPVGVSQGPPAISIAPPPIPAGTSATLIIASSGGFDLSSVSSGQVTISPSENISGVTASGLTLSFNLASCARAGTRMLTIRANNAAAAVPFAVTAVQDVPLIGISPTQVVVGSSPTLSVTSSGCFDLSRVGIGQVSISPNDGISNISVGNTTATGLTLSFTLDASARQGSRTLVIRATTSPRLLPSTCPRCLNVRAVSSAVTGILVLAAPDVRRSGGARHHRAGPGGNAARSILIKPASASSANPSIPRASKYADTPMS